MSTICRRSNLTFSISALCATVIITLLILSYQQRRVEQHTCNSDSECLNRHHSWSRGSRAAEKPNLVFILADDYGWHDIGYHGSEIETPTLDYLAGGGVKLENYYVQPICTPTRSQLLSGRYQIHTGLQHSLIWPDRPNCLPLETPTLADKLKAVGYSTHMVGKWHLGFYRNACTPLHRGFDSFYGYLSGAKDYFTHSRCVSLENQDLACGVDLRDGHKVVWNNNQYSTNLFTERAQQTINNHDKSQPLFMYLPYQSVHTPLQVPKQYVEKYRFIKDESRRLYAGMVSALDEGVRNVTTSLKNAGLWDNTILVFSTDNGGQVLGGASNYPLRGNKGTLWEGGMRGNGFVHSPLLKRSGVTVHDLIHVSDWFPTLLELAGGSTAGLKLDGHNIWDTISKGTPSPRKEILHNIDPLTPPIGTVPPGGQFDIRIRAALRYGDWKIITGDPGEDKWFPKPSASEPDAIQTPKPAGKLTKKKNLWLFNIHNDPEERIDLSSERPDIVAMLLNQLHMYNSTAVPTVYPERDSRADPRRLGGAWGPWE